MFTTPFKIALFVFVRENQMDNEEWTIQIIMQLLSINLILIANSGISYQLRDAYFAWKP
jgi:hypothetical protein